jgi:hypothetical protein
MTIAALAYDGVYRKHYLQPDTIKYVGRPKRGNYSAISIEWLRAYDGYQEDIYSAR